MNEILLISMLGELDPSLLEDDYMEKDMKKGFLSFLFHFLKKTVFQIDYKAFEQTNSEEESKQNENKHEVSAFEDTIRDDSFENKNEVNASKTSEMEIINTNMDTQFEEELPISVFKRNFSNLFKIISGIVAAFILVIGIIVILIKRHKSGTKLYEKKIQIIY